VKEGSDLVNESGTTLKGIVDAVKKVNDIVAEISTASEQQAKGLEEINRAILGMDEITQQNAALVEEAAAASESLGSQATTLDELISFFNVRTGNEQVVSRVAAKR
jgi:methyl-accepting chemotaxis protein